MLGCSLFPESPLLYFCSRANLCRMIPRLRPRNRETSPNQFIINRLRKQAPRKTRRLSSCDALEPLELICREL
jgi:hypothetical protein